MVIVCRALCLEPEEDTSDLARLFPDPETVSAWAAPYVTALVHHDIVHGTIVPGGVPLLEGQRICTRAALKTGDALSVAKVYGLDSETYTELVNARMIH